MGHNSTEFGHWVFKKDYVWQYKNITIDKEVELWERENGNTFVQGTKEKKKSTNYERAIRAEMFYIRCGWY